MIDYSMISPLAYADDDEDDRMFFEEAIQEIFPEIKMKLFSNGKLLLTYIVSNLSAGNLPRLIFLDLNMPVMNGIECLLELKKNKLLTNIPIVIYTTSSYQSDRRKLEEIGVTHFLTKETSQKRMQLQLKNIIGAFCQKEVMQ
ncbi:response regulator [Zobellia laminariae]|uniref:response regulator n=1 Tax=Zobellia laminariae TaxID=248906 RepID=UPI0026F46F12|nr:response regulator [Zobellia laminariae]WKX76358.1 response regulator [Zobellia laminariae]